MQRIPISGWVADRFGSRSIFAAAMQRLPSPHCSAGTSGKRLPLAGLQARS